MFVKYGQQDSGVYITGTQGALHSSNVTWLKGWDRLSLALQCIPQVLIRDLTIQQQNYLRTKGRELHLSSHRYTKIYCPPILHIPRTQNLVIICCSCKGKEIFVSPNKPTIFSAFLLLLLSPFCKVPNNFKGGSRPIKRRKILFQKCIKKQHQSQEWISECQVKDISNQLLQFSLHRAKN